MCLFYGSAVIFRLHILKFNKFSFWKRVNEQSSLKSYFIVPKTETEASYI